MKKYFKNLLAKIRLRTLFGIYGTEKKIDLLIEYIIKNNIKPTSLEEYCVKFKCGEIWNANKYYAWLSQGNFTIEGQNIRWRNEMPSFHMMLKFKNYIDSFGLKREDEKFLESLLGDNNGR